MTFLDQPSSHSAALPGSIGTPEHTLKTAKGAGTFLYALAGLNLVFGAFVQFAGHDPIFGGNAGGWPMFLSAILLATLGFFVHRKLSLIALAIAIGYLLFDSVAIIVMQAEAGARPGVGGIVMRVFFVIILVGAFKSIRRYKKTLQSA